MEETQNIGGQAVRDQAEHPENDPIDEPKEESNSLNHTLVFEKEYSPLEAAIILGIKDMRKIQREMSRYLLGSGRHNDHITGREIAKYIMDLRGLLHTIGSPRHPVDMLRGKNGDVGDAERYWKKANDYNIESIEVPHIVMPIHNFDGFSGKQKEFMRFLKLAVYYSEHAAMRVPMLKEILAQALERIVFETRFDGRELVYRGSGEEKRYPVVRFYVAKGCIYRSIKDVTAMVVRCRIFGETYPYQMLTERGMMSPDKNHYVDLSVFAEKVELKPDTVRRYINSYKNGFPDQPIAICADGSHKRLYNASEANITYFLRLKQENRANLAMLNRTFKAKEHWRKKR